ncbi:hypothetical protein LVJ94_16670 [Pendulispora rubella]|uniref:Uncharacterized protein n=1 Tax=Pendulispora rubella TaxID=2741070 RepID=A0ABZ2LI74_9BACT
MSVGRTTAFVACALVLSCAPGPALFVHTARIGQASQPEMGQPVTFGNITRPDQAGHPKSDFALLSNQEDWDLFFADHPQHAQSRSVDFKKVVVLASYVAEPDASQLETTQVIDNGSAFHVYMRETFPGDGCKPHTGGKAYELITLPKAKKTVHVHVDSVRGAACGASVGATVACHLNSDPKWVGGNFAAKVGDVVECKASIQAGGRLVVDRTWLLTEAPKGSVTKLQFQDGGASVRFPTDVFGRYRVRVEVTDEDSKRGIAQTVVDAAVGEGTFVEMAWSNFELSSDASKFPKVELHATDVPGAPPARHDCSVVTGGVDRPGWCEVQTHAASTVMRLHKEPAGRFAVHVKYVSERTDASPVLCVRTLSAGAVVTEGCDAQTRKAGALWELGTMDEASGGFDGRAILAKNGVANIELDQPLPATVLALPDLERRYVARYYFDAQPAEGFRLAATGGGATVAPEVWAIVADGPYAEWDRKFGPGPAPPAISKAAVVAARAGAKVKLIVIESPRVTTRQGLGVGSSLADITAKLGPKSPFPVAALFGKDECAVSDGNVRFSFATCDEARAGGRVTRVVMGTPTSK